MSYCNCKALPISKQLCICGKMYGVHFAQHPHGSYVSNCSGFQSKENSHAKPK